MRVAVLGTGIMGAAMARNIAAAGHDVVVWNRTRDRAAETGLPVAETPQEAAREADVVVTMLYDLDAVQETVDGVDFGDAAWLQSSTVGLGVDELAARFSNLVDAPVMGSRKPAEDGQLTLLMSGPSELRDRVRPVAEAVAAKVIDVSDRVGDASRLKIVINAWLIIVTEGAAEVLTLAEAAGLDPSIVLETLAGGALDIPYVQQKGRDMLARSFPPQFKLETADKDLHLVQELAARSGVDLGLIDAADKSFGRALEHGHGDEDIAAVWYGTGSAG
jgi:3-hydroxyisobutyrate dehydrogenase